MNLSLNRRLNNLLKQYVPASPELAEEISQWLDDWQKETSNVDHADLKKEIQELKLDLKDVKAELKEDIRNVRAELKEDIHRLDTSMVLLRSELKEQIGALEKNMSQIKTHLRWNIGFLASVAIPLLLKLFNVI